MCIVLLCLVLHSVLLLVPVVHFGKHEAQFCPAHFTYYNNTNTLASLQDVQQVQQTSHNILFVLQEAKYYWTVGPGKLKCVHEIKNTCFSMSFKTVDTSTIPSLKATCLRPSLDDESAEFIFQLNCMPSNVVKRFPVQ